MKAGWLERAFDSARRDRDSVSVGDAIRFVEAECVEFAKNGNHGSARDCAIVVDNLKKVVFRMDQKFKTVGR